MKRKEGQLRGNERRTMIMRGEEGTERRKMRGRER